MEIYGWLESSVALYWILNGNRKWKQFVSNRVKEINKRIWIIWRHCATNQNPADIGSRGIKNGKIPQIWFNMACQKEEENEDFRRSIKDIIAKSGTPALIISDNGK